MTHCIHRTFLDIVTWEDIADGIEARSLCSDCGTQHVEFRLSGWELPELAPDTRSLPELAEATGLSEETMRAMTTALEEYNRGDM